MPELVAAALRAGGEIAIATGDRDIEIDVDSTPVPVDCVTTTSPPGEDELRETGIGIVSELGLELGTG